jgi:hypothetical protein
MVICCIPGSCIEPMDLNFDQNEFLIVVDGKITQKNTIHQLFLNRTTAYGNKNRIHVSGADIRLYDETGTYESFIEDISNEYYYLTGYGLPMEPGKTYYIEIMLQNDRVYRSVPQVMPRVIEADTVVARGEIVEELSNAGIIVERKYVNVYLNTSLKNVDGPAYFIWRSDHVYSFTEIQCHPLHVPKVCYIKKQHMGDELEIFSGEDIEGSFLSEHQVVTIPLVSDWEFYEKNFYNVAQHSITKDAYEYWSLVNKIARPTGSIFDTPPAPIKGNIYNVNDPDETVLGFFEVSAVDTVRTYTNYSDLSPMVIIDRCPYLNSETYNDPPCCNCLSLDHSDTERPYYWGE